eukprot:4169590-Amphidinium_carterae.1
MVPRDLHEQTLRPEMRLCELIPRKQTIRKDAMWHGSALPVHRVYHTVGVVKFMFIGLWQ